MYRNAVRDEGARSELSDTAAPEKGPPTASSMGVSAASVVRHLGGHMVEGWWPFCWH